jgi:hypothetical protein
MNSDTCLEDSSIRLDALRALSLFNANPDERFDRFVRLAKRLFNVPVAKVTLVAPDMVYTIPSTGDGKAPIARELSFCAQAIKSDEVMVVPDTLADGGLHIIGRLDGDTKMYSDKRALS